MVPFIRGVVAGCLALGLVGCATSSDGTRERTGLARFDASSVSSPTASYSLQSDGTWAGMRGDRYMVKNDEIQAVAPFATSGPIVGGSTKIFIDRDDNGLHFTPTAGQSPNWTFVTEDGGAIPRDLEVPLYIAARLGLGGLWVTYHDPDYREEWWHLGTDCEVVVFDLQGRRVAGWVQRRGGTRCPETRFPDARVLAILEQGRREHWVSPNRPPVTD